MLATAQQLSLSRLDSRAQRLIPTLSFAGDVSNLDAC